MAANEADVFQKTGLSTATTLSSPGYTIGNTSVNVASTTNWPTTTGITFAIDEIDSAGERVAGTYNVFRGTVSSATQINNLTYVGGDANRNYSASSSTRVYMTISAYRENRLVDGLTAEHSQLDGTHSTTLITSRTADTNPASGDYVLTYDTSATALKKVSLADLFKNPPSTAGTDSATDWKSSLLPAYSSATYNGNRSYDVTFASTLATLVTPGQRMRFTRTVAAPTQCTDLESGSSQYWSKTTPSGVSFTDTPTCMAWIKLESYTGSDQIIIARKATGTAAGWEFKINSLGQVVLRAGNTAGNLDDVTSYQSVPLGKWVHVAAALTMSTSASSKVLIDGVVVPTSFTNGTSTTISQSGNLTVGATNTPDAYFDGKIAQVAVFSAIISDSTIRSYISQGLAGSETSLVSAYSFNNSANDLNTGNANNLSANGAATATNADSPFSQDANGTIGSYDFGVVTKIATTVATVQVPEGCAIPTSGGVSTVDLGTGVPFGFPKDRGKWNLASIFRVDFIQSSPSSGTWYNMTSTSGTSGGCYLTYPVGKWYRGYRTIGYVPNGTNAPDMSITLSTGSSTESDKSMTTKAATGLLGATAYVVSPMQQKDELTTDFSAATPLYLNMKTGVASAGSLNMRGSTDAEFRIIAEFALL